MATSWKSQQGDGTYRLQFETDDVEKYKLVEKSAQMAVDGKTTADVVEVCRCGNCKYCTTHTCAITGIKTLFCEYGNKPVVVEPTHYCGYGERRKDNDL